MRTETVHVDLKFNVTRDLEENEVLCPVCSGTSLHIQGIPLAQVTNGVYELNTFGKFQTISGCNSCYFGKQKKCMHCSKLLGRNSYCGCEGEMQQRRYREQQKELELYNKAIKIKSDDKIAKNMTMYYSEHYPYNEGYFSEFEEFIEAWEDNHDLDEEKPKHVWGTTCSKLSLDVYSILENACEELHEEAFDNIEDQDELDEFLTKWCAKQKGTETYYMNQKYAIEIPW